MKNNCLSKKQPVTVSTVFANPVSTTLLWVLTLGNIMLSFLGVFSLILGVQYADFLIVISVLTLVLLTGLIIRDIIVNPVKKRIFWLIIIIIFPLVSIVFYLLQRDDD